MPAKSKNQQQLFGLALSVKRGETPRSEVSKDVLNIVDSMTEKEIKDFAETKHKGLPNKKKNTMNEAIKNGKRYGSWTVTNYEPIEWDEYGAPFGGRIKLVNQDNMDSVLIQNDMALRGSKWKVSYDGRRIIDKNPEVVIKKLIKIYDSAENTMNENKIMLAKLFHGIREIVKEELNNSINEGSREERLWGQVIDRLDSKFKNYNTKSTNDVNKVAKTIESTFANMPQRVAMNIATVYHSYKNGEYDKNEAISVIVDDMKNYRKDESLVTLERGAKFSRENGKKYVDYMVNDIESISKKQLLDWEKKVGGKYTLRTNAGVDIHSKELKNNTWKGIRIEKVPYSRMKKLMGEMTYAPLPADKMAKLRSATMKRAKSNTSKSGLTPSKRKSLRNRIAKKEEQLIELKREWDELFFELEQRVPKEGDSAAHELAKPMERVEKKVRKLESDIQDLEKQLNESINEVKVNKKDIVFKEKTKNGYYRAVVKRDTSRGRGTQDEFSMVIIDKSGDIKKGWGTHPSLDGAKKFLKGKDYDPNTSSDGIL